MSAAQHGTESEARKEVGWPRSLQVHLVACVLQDAGT